MLELIVTDTKHEKNAARIRRALEAVDRASRWEIGPGWVRVASQLPAARFLSALAEAGINAVVWSEG